MSSASRPNRLRARQQPLEFMRRARSRSPEHRERLDPPERAHHEGGVRHPEIVGPVVAQQEIARAADAARWPRPSTASADHPAQEADLAEHAAGWRPASWPPKVAAKPSSCTLHALEQMHRVDQVRALAPVQDPSSGSEALRDARRAGRRQPSTSPRENVWTSRRPRNSHMPASGCHELRVSLLAERLEPLQTAPRPRACRAAGRRRRATTPRMAEP